MEKGKAFGTSMSPYTYLDTDTTGKEVDEKLYRGTVVLILYLRASRLNLMFSVCKCARFHSAPMECQLTVVKCIILYLIRTANMGLWCPFYDNFDFS